MPLEWKKSAVKKKGLKYEVEHWTNRDGKEIVNAVLSKPLLKTGDKPKVTLHKFGNSYLAVRYYNDNPDGIRTFNELKKVWKTTTQ